MFTKRQLNSNKTLGSPRQICNIRLPQLHVLEVWCSGLDKPAITFSTNEIKNVYKDNLLDLSGINIIMYTTDITESARKKRSQSRSELLCL